MSYEENAGYQAGLNEWKYDPPNSNQPNAIENKDYNKGWDRGWKKRQSWENNQ